VSETLRKLLSANFERYGEILTFNIDANREILTMKVQLKGDRDPINITLGGCELAQKEGSDFFYATKISCDRIWLYEWLIDHPNLLSFQIPPIFVPLVKTMLKKE
jgi:hypothetical protein